VPILLPQVKKTTKPNRALRKVFIVEDHPVFRRGLIQLVNDEKDLMVCGQSDSAEKALNAIERSRPDLVLIDLTLPGKNGLELLKEIRATGSKVKLLVISMHDEALYAERVLRAGGDGYIMKQEDPEELVHAMRDVLGGHLYISDAVMDAVTNGAAGMDSEKASPIDELTDAELEVLESIGKGKSPADIARGLAAKPAFVTKQIDQIKKKLRLTGEAALIRYAVCWVETGAT
jgi:DNA-binding NarL/FixJ family response regulator